MALEKPAMDKPESKQGQTGTDGKGGTTGHGTKGGKGTGEETPKGNAPKGSGGVKPDGRTLLGGTATGKHDDEAAKEGGNSGVAVKISEQKDVEKASEIKRPELLYFEEGNTLVSEVKKDVQNVRVIETKNPTNMEGSKVRINISFYAYTKGEMRFFHFTDVEAYLRLNADNEKAYEIAKSVTYEFEGGIKVLLEQEKILKNKD